MKFRALIVAAVSMAALVVGSGIAQAMPRLNPIW
jgi:hypothetical protein